MRPHPKFSAAGGYTSAITRNPAVGHHYPAWRALGDVTVMRDQDYCGAGPPETLDNVDHQAAVGAVEVARWFVRDEQSRSIRDCPRDRRSLLLTA
jgi:hypothetical protein